MNKGTSDQSSDQSQTRELLPEVSSKNIDLVLKPLSNPLRQKLLLILAEGPVTYTEVLNRLQIESGSFYWHIGKMGSLVQQNQLKEYYLSDLGNKAYELLTYDDTVQSETNNYPYRPDWYLSIYDLTRRIYNLPGWVLIQQIVVVLFFTIYLFSRNDIMQLGSIPVIYSNHLNIALISVMSSLTVIVVGLLIMQVVYIRPDRDHFKKSWLFLVIRLALASTTIFLPGIIFAGMIELGMYNLVNLGIFQLVISVMGLSLTISFTTTMVDRFLDLGLKDSLLIVLPPYYVLVLISFFFSP